MVTNIKKIEDEFSFVAGETRAMTGKNLDNAK